MNRALASTLVGIVLSTNAISVVAQEVIEANPVFKAAKIFNTLDQQVGLDYQFEDDNWRHRHIEPQSWQYAFDLDPKHQLTISLRTNSGPQPYVLDTSNVYTDSVGGRVLEPDVRRHDQARPYHVGMGANGQIGLFSGFPPIWKERFRQRAGERLRATNVDLSVFTSSIDPSRIDVLGPTLEFEAASSILKSEYQRLMSSNVAPTLSIDWEQRPDVPSLFRPIILVCGCETQGGQEFFKEAIQSLFKEQLQWSVDRIVYKCCASVAVEIANLEAKYVRDGQPDMVALSRDVMNHLTEKSKLAPERVDRIGPTQRRISTVWRYFSNNSLRYKLLIDLTVIKPEGQPYGVEFNSILIGQKRIGRSDRWARLADFAIYELGASVQETLHRDGGGTNPSETTRLKVDDSFIVKFCRDTSVEMAHLVSGSSSSVDEEADRFE